MVQTFDGEQALRAWQRFVQMGELMPYVPAPIARSWFRCKNRGQLPVQLLPHGLEQGSPEMTTANNALPVAFRETFASLMDYLAWDELLLALISPQGLLLEWQGNHEFLSTKPLATHMILSEETLGTMAISLTQQEREVFFVQGAQHYYSCYHQLASFAIPLVNGEDYLGVLGGWGPVANSRLVAITVSLGGRVIIGELD